MQNIERTAPAKSPSNASQPLTPRRNCRRTALLSTAYLLGAFPLVLMVYQGLPVPLVPHSPLVFGILVSLVLLAVARELMRREGRSVAELGLAMSARTWRHLTAGLAAGALLFGTATLLLRLLLPLEWQFNPAFVPTAMVGALVFHLVSNTCEELAWRGYAFDGLLRCFGHWPAQALIALVGALFHVMCGWSWQVALVSTTAGSLLFGLVFVRWRSVPAAIGVHSAWNWTRDLVMSPGTAAAVLEVQGPQRWGVAQWQIAQGVYVGVTLAACAALLLKLCARRAAYREPR